MRLNQKRKELGFLHNRDAHNDSAQTAQKTKGLLKPCGRLDALSSSALHRRNDLPQSFLTRYTKEAHGGGSRRTRAPAPEAALRLFALCLFEVSGFSCRDLEENFA